MMSSPSHLEAHRCDSPQWSPGSSLGAAVGLLLQGDLISTGTVLLMRRRRDRLG
jgi:hypothetical protein